MFGMDILNAWCNILEKFTEKEMSQCEVKNDSYERR